MQAKYAQVAKDGSPLLVVNNCMASPGIQQHPSALGKREARVGFGLPLLNLFLWSILVHIVKTAFLLVTGPC